MKIPSKGVGNWCRELVAACSASRDDRIQRGAALKNLYLTGSENGEPQTYNKSFVYIDALSSYLFSPVELRWQVEAPRGASTSERAMCKTATAEMHRITRQSGVDTKIEDAVNWALVKGKTFGKFLWDDGLSPHVVQPEYMGVLDESKSSLSDQEAFYQSIYMLPEQFARLIADHPDNKELMRKVSRYSRTGTQSDEDPNRAQILKTVILGGVNPFQESGSGDPNNRGIVNWLESPRPVFSPEIMAKLIRLDEIWVWDDDRDDWTTLQTVAEDGVIEGRYVHRNLFADAPGVTPGENRKNPLRGHHPFVEFCANPLDGYFWGRSELSNVGMLQLTLNARIDGINHILRMQEKPPFSITGSTSVNQVAINRLNKPSGWFSDSNPNVKIEKLAPDLPAGLYESIREVLSWFDDMAGFAPIMQGRGESGTRSQGQAETMVRMASPRFKDRAILIEREVEEAGALMMAMAQANDPEKHTAWVPEKEAGPVGAVSENFAEGPAPGLKAVDFTLMQLPAHFAVRIDSHSSSPAFSQDALSKLIMLARMGAVGPKELVEHTHPSGEDDLVAAIERKDANQAALFAQHPELALKAITGGRKK